MCHSHADYNHIKTFSRNSHIFTSLSTEERSRHEKIVQQVVKHRKARELRVRNSRAKHETDKYFRQPSKNRSSGSLFSLHVRYTTNDILEHSTLVMITICAHIALLKKKIITFFNKYTRKKGISKKLCEK